MKKVFLAIAILFMASVAQASDVTISIRIPEEKVATALEGFLKLYPNNETIADPEWVDPEDGSEAPQVAKYTTKGWVTEKVRRIIIRDVRRGLQSIQNQQNQVEEDNDLAVSE